MQFDVLWRRGATDQLIATFTHHFDRPSGAQSFDAVPFDGDADGVAAAANPGDLLVLRFTALASGEAGPAFIPNGDGSHTHGRIPSLSLP